MNYYTEKPEIILDNLTEVEKWLIDIKISITGTRFEEILNYFKLIVKYKQETSIENFIKIYGFEIYLYTMNDAISFIDIYKGFSIKKGSLPIKKIRECIKGPLIPRNEILGDANVNSRNIFFELELCSKMIRNGISITGFNDININFEFYNIFIECKRLLSLSNISNNIKIAYEQLSKKLLHKNDRGIIALTFDKAFNLDDKCYEASSLNDIDIQLNNFGNIFMKNHSHCWNSFLNIKIIGIILLIKFPAIFDGKIINSQQLCVISLRSDTNVSDKNLLHRFAEKLT